MATGDVSQAQATTLGEVTHSGMYVRKCIALGDVCKKMHCTWGQQLEKKETNKNSKAQVKTNYRNT